MAIISKQDHYGCPAPRPMLGGSDVTGWIVEHVVAKVEGEALARIKGQEYSRQREAKKVNIGYNIILPWVQPAYMVSRCGVSFLMVKWQE